MRVGSGVSVGEKVGVVKTPGFGEIKGVLLLYGAGVYEGGTCGVFGWLSVEFAGEMFASGDGAIVERMPDIGVRWRLQAVMKTARPISRIR